MEGYAQWTAEESRLAGWMPFHYYNRLWAPTPDSGQVQTTSLSFLEVLLDIEFVSCL